MPAVSPAFPKLTSKDLVWKELVNWMTEEALVMLEMKKKTRKGPLFIRVFIMCDWKFKESTEMWAVDLTSSLTKETLGVQHLEFGGPTKWWNQRTVTKRMHMDAAKMETHRTELGDHPEIHGIYWHQGQVNWMGYFGHVALVCFVFRENQTHQVYQHSPSFILETKSTSKLQLNAIECNWMQLMMMMM